MPGAYAVVTAGDRTPLKGDEIEHLAEGDRAHGEINAPQPGDNRTDDRRLDRADHDAIQDGERRARLQVFYGHCGAIGAEAEIGGMAEGQDAGEAQEKI